MASKNSFSVLANLDENLQYYPKEGEIYQEGKWTYVVPPSRFQFIEPCCEEDDTEEGQEKLKREYLRVFAIQQMEPGIWVRYPDEEIGRDGSICREQGEGIFHHDATFVAKVKRYGEEPYGPVFIYT